MKSRLAEFGIRRIASDRGVVASGLGISAFVGLAAGGLSGVLLLLLNRDTLAYGVSPWMIGGWFLLLSALVAVVTAIIGVAIVKGRMGEGDTLWRVFQETPDGLLVCDSQDRVVLSNPGMQALLGRIPQPGTPEIELYHPDHREGLRHQLSLRRTNQTGLYESGLNRADGLEQRVLVTGTPIFDKKGHYVGAFGIFKDVSRLHERLTREKLQARLETLQATVARLNHHINNCLTVIRGQAFLAGQKDPDSPHTGTFEIIMRQADSIGEELEKLSALKEVATVSYLEGFFMLRDPREQGPE